MALQYGEEYWHGDSNCMKWVLIWPKLRHRKKILNLEYSCCTSELSKNNIKSNLKFFFLLINYKHSKI